MADTVFTRRDLLKLAGAAGAAAATAEAAAGAEAQGRRAAPAREPLRALTAHEADLLDRIAALLVPSDENGPGAAEAMAVRYIDRALAGALQDQREAYRVGLAALERYASLTRGAPFLQLSETRQISLLIDVETGTATGANVGFAASSAQFFALVRGHVMQGTFGDPYYGGNTGFVGWDLIGYPGVRTYVAPGEQRLLSPPTRVRTSAYDNPMFNKAIADLKPAGAIAMPTNLPGTDVVVIGLGAAGGVAVLPLADAGLSVVGLEAGTWLTGKDFAPDEIRNNVRDWPMAVQKCNREVPTHRVNAKAPTTRAPGHVMMNGVGGTTLHYWAQSWRLSPWDFKVVSDTARRYGRSRLPAGSTVEDWPFGYEELEPYYDVVEHEIGVSGQAGNLLGAIDQRGNIYEAPRRRPYPMPPLRSTGYLDRMTAAARALGWHPFPGPAAINSVRYQDRSPCMYHGFCNRGGCHVDAKNGPNVTTIPRAQQTGRLKVVTEAHVTRIDVDGQGKATGVTYVTGKEEFFQPAKVVLLSTYTYENSRLLLLSTSKAFPKGLANNHDQVGRHYFSHATGASVTALFPFNLNSWYGLPAQGVAVDNWADDNFDHGPLDFIGGGNLWVFSDRRPIGAANMNTFGRTPSWGKQWKAFVKENADRSNTAYLQKTTLPYEDNLLDLDPEVKDPLGFPVCRITADYKDNERKIADFIQEKMELWFRAAGAIDIVRGPLGTMGVNTHAYGGTRMGDNPESNVVNRYGFAHEVPNLGVLGASVMGTSGAHNPTLTVQALAWRTAEHLVKHWKTIAE